MSNNAEDDDDGLFDEDDDDDSSDEEIGAAASKKKVSSSTTKKRKADSSAGDDSDEAPKKSKPKKPKKQSWIDDAAEESGEEGGGDDDDDEDDDEDNNDYVKDDFVVDEADVEVEKKKRTGDLEDSDEDDDDDDSDDDDDDHGIKKSKRKKFKKVKQTTMLSEEDLMLIREARGEQEPDDYAEQERRKKVVAQNEAELRKGLFIDDSGDEGGDGAPAKQRRPVEKERFDEEGMDDFIDDDIDILGAARREMYDDGGQEGVSEAQLNEASEIFGTEYLEFMDKNDGADQDEQDLFGESAYRERGVGVDLGVDSEEESSDEEDEDDDELFGDDDGDGGVQAHQKSEALKLKRKKKELARQERRRQKEQRRNEARKIQLRRAFEPAQLVENFCTDRDDEIRRSDAPERFFDWKTPFHGSTGDEITEEEEEEALWIMGRIPEIAAEYVPEGHSNLEEIEKREKSVVNSIVHALRYMHTEKLEPAFIKRYRKDIITSPAVRDNLYHIMSEDAEWDTMVSARDKVGHVLSSIGKDVQKDEATGAEADSVIQLEANLAAAQEKLEESAKQEAEIKEEIEGLGSVEEEKNDDDDDELFGDDDEDDDKKARKEKKTSLEKHLATVQALLQDRAEKVATLETQLQDAQSLSQDSLKDQGPARRVLKKICRENIWNERDIESYQSVLTDLRHIVDVSSYLNLIKEGNDAIRKKEMPMAESAKSRRDRRTRRFDHDFYRTCVSEGHRAICYRFLLSPNRVGIKIEDILSSPTREFDFTKTMPDEDAPQPQRWVPPTIESQSPSEFANELIGSGELVLLSSSGGADSTDQENTDPLRGCRYVAAMELSHEPRVRRYLRNIYRRHAVLTTRPTKKGKETIDAFHDYFGLHLVKNKPIKEHFPMEENEALEKKASLDPEVCKELDAEMKKREKHSCLQYLNMLKAEQTGHVAVHIHLPLLDQLDDWYDHDEEFSNREKQNVSALMNELESVYFPLDVDSEEWNEERRKVLKQTLISFLLPRFEAETRRELREAAMKIGVAAAGESLYNMAMEGPYRPQAMMHTENRFLHPTGDLSIVGICSSTDSKDGTYFASITHNGEFGDHLAIPGGARIDSNRYREKVITFLLQNRPNAVLVGTSGGFDSRMMCRKMNEIINEALQRWNNRGIQGEDEDDEDFESRRAAMDAFETTHAYGDDDDDEEPEWKCNVDLIDDSVPQLFGRGVRAKNEFPDHATNLNIAISIARQAKDPLGELTYAWSVASDTGMFGAEMLYLNVHPMQQLLPRYLLVRSYERALCEAVAEVGVDINAACTYKHLHGLLSFVPGLGPRKAADLKQSLMQLGGSVASRRDLLEKRLMGPNVYNNSVAFLRIREFDTIDGSLLHPLDDTRLHPDVYHRNNWAAKIATDALERVEVETKRDSAGKAAIRDVMDDSRGEVERLYMATKEEWENMYGPTFNVADWDPKVNVPADSWRDKVEELDLDTFAEMIEQNGLGKWHSHLRMIKWEFRLPFADPRKPMETLTGNKLFELITGETDQTLRPGKEITGKVLRNGDFGSRIKLEGDIPAFIPLRNLADDHVESAEDIVQVGMIVTAIVTEVKKDHMSCDMSLKMEDIRKPLSSWERPSSLPELDEHFDLRTSESLEEIKNKQREARLEAMCLSLGAIKLGEDGAPKKRVGKVTRRACAHPAFRNAKNDEVDKELKEGGAAMVSEALIRPSSKSSDTLAIHWVVKEGSIKVIEVQEEDKDTDASIGQVLKVKNETYGSIDELLGRYIAPMNDFVEELTNHRKFLDMSEEDLDERLRKEKAANPKGVFYNICWMELHPGYGSLRFILSSTPRHHPIGISPSGFVWGSKTYSSLDRLLNDFKKNPRGASAASRSPPASSAPPPPKPQDAVAKPSRWGDRPAPPPPPPAGAGWARPPPPPVPPAGGDWGAAQAPGGGQWNRPPPPNMPPPPSTLYGRPPPPSFRRPPPPGPPPSYQSNQPPPPPGYPPRV